MIYRVPDRIQLKFCSLTALSQFIFCFDFFQILFWLLYYRGVRGGRNNKNGLVFGIGVINICVGACVCEFAILFDFSFFCYFLFRFFDLLLSSCIYKWGAGWENFYGIYGEFFVLFWFPYIVMILQVSCGVREILLSFSSQNEKF